MFAVILSHAGVGTEDFGTASSSLKCSLEYVCMYLYCHRPECPIVFLLFAGVFIAFQTDLLSDLF